MNRIVFHALFLAMISMISCKTTVTTKDNCGDGFLDPGEACDGSLTGGVTCESLGYYRVEGQVVCNSDCEFDISDCGLARCGDGTIQTGDGEQCEGENLGGFSCVTLGYETGTLACGGDCHYDLSACVASADCGNGTLQEGEQCDGLDFGGDTCQTLGYYGGNLVCSSACLIDASDCEDIGRCGDGRIQTSQGEECEGTNLDGQTCESLDFYGGTLSCGDDCHLILTDCARVGRCGDGLIQNENGEDCDGDNLDSQSCGSMGYYGGTLSCDACTWNLASCEAAGGCGDGFIQSGEGETCDGSNLNGDSCETLSYYGGTLACDGQCQQDRSDCIATGRCGDLIVQSGYGETCDGTNLDGGNCALQGFWGGSLACSACTLNETGCVTLAEISAGGLHTCALDSHGAAWCWGLRSSGQLGDGSTSNSSPIPVAVTVNPGTSFTDIAAGSNFTCAIDQSGVARCWGAGTHGQLGTSDTQPRLVPTPVSMPAGKTFIAIGAGNLHACALTTDGAIYCWGYNYHGRIGDGTEESRYVPVPVSSGIVFAKLIVGAQHSCGVTTTKGLYCWGENNFGQVADGVGTSVLSPLYVGTPSDRGVNAVALGYYHTCIALDGAGLPNLYCKGQNSQGQLGIGNISNMTTFSQVGLPTGANIVEVTAGDLFTCSLTDDGLIHCWGTNELGQLGDGLAATGRTYPARITTIPANKAFDRLEAGSDHICVRDMTELPWCWGNNSFSQLGDYTNTNSNVPVAVWPM